MNGWWNPNGDASFRLIDCQITQGFINGESANTGDIYVADSDQRVCGKIVDLDPEQQLVSELWGLEVRIVKPDGTALLKGKYKVAPFTDIWWQRPISQAGGDMGASAVYQSIIEDIEWADFSADDYPILSALKEQTTGNMLSIRFVVDSYNMVYGQPNFTRGRISGAIGPVEEDEPAHFTIGRQFFPEMNANEDPIGGLFFAVGKAFKETKSFLLDLGNSLPFTEVMGPISDVGSLYLAYTDTNGDVKVLNNIPYSTQSGWYETTSGIIAIDLTDDQIDAIESTPIFIVSDPNKTPLLSETPGGYHVRADLFVARLYPEALEEQNRFEPKEIPADEAHFRIFTSQFGKPLPHAKVLFHFDAGGLQPVTMVQGRNAPRVNTPEAGLDFPLYVTSDEHGIAYTTFKANDPKNPRKYIDGQVYGVRYFLEKMLPYSYSSAKNWLNPSDFISVLVWNKFEGAADWETTKPIMQQYANLYPLMDQFIDLASEKDLLEQRDALLMVFGFDPENPNYMPVTRDLSPAKRKVILDWLRSAEKVERSTAPTCPAQQQPAAESAAPTHTAPLRGGKTEAAKRRLSKNLHKPGIH